MKTTREVLTRLSELQQWDHAIDRTEARRSDLRRGVVTAQATLDAKAALKATAHRATQESVAETHRKEMDLKAKEGEIEKCTVALNTASNNKEYSALLLKIGMLKAECGKIEELILLAMDAQEAKEREEDATAAVVKEAEAGLRAAEAKSAEREGSLEDELAHARQRRETVAASIPGPLRAVYERLLGGPLLRGKRVAVVSPKGEFCQGCFMKLMPQAMSDLVAGVSLVRCQSCSRIVVLDVLPQTDDDDE